EKKRRMAVLLPSPSAQFPTTSSDASKRAIPLPDYSEGRRKVKPSLPVLLLNQRNAIEPLVDRSGRGVHARCRRTVNRNAAGHPIPIRFHQAVLIFQSIAAAGHRIPPDRDQAGQLPDGRLRAER